MTGVDTCRSLTPNTITFHLRVYSHVIYEWLLEKTLFTDKPRIELVVKSSDNRPQQQQQWWPITSTSSHLLTAHYHLIHW